MLTTYTLDGTRTRFTFDWPYLERSHIMVTVDLAARPFKFISDHEIEVKSIFGEPLPEGKLKIFRVTPDLISLAEFKNAAKLSASDLNRARLQCLFLIQERSGGMGGSIAQAVQLLTNEIETISGALDTLEVSLGVLTAGLQTLDDLNAKIVVVTNEAAALRDALNQEIIDRAEDITAIEQRVQTVEVSQGNLSAQVTQQVSTLLMADLAQAHRSDTLEARIDNVDSLDKVTDMIAASLIQTSVAQAKGDKALVRTITTLEATMRDDVRALLQEERLAWATADAAFAQQLLTLQATVDEDIAQVIEDMQATADRVDGVSAQWTMKAVVQRADGSPVFAGIGLAATSNNEISKSEIVMQADRLVFVAADALEATPKTIMAAGLVDGSPTLVIPSNNMGDRSYPGRILVDGSIEGRSIKANEITGDKLKAGTITTREIDVALGVNILQSSTFVDGLTGWTTGGNLGATFGVDLDANWTAVGGHTAYIYENGAAHAGDGAYNAILASVAFAVTPSTRYEFSAYTGAHRANVYLRMYFYNAAGVIVHAPFSDYNMQEASGGVALATYKRIGGFGNAPATAASARLFFVKDPTTAGNADSYGMIAYPFVAEAKPNQTRFAPWGPSGLGTRITPAGITTPSLSAISANLGTITAGHLDVGTIFAGSIRADRVDIIDTLMVRGGAITLGLQATGNNHASLWHNVPAGQTHSMLLVASFGSTAEVPHAVMSAYSANYADAKATATLTNATGPDVQNVSSRDYYGNGMVTSFVYSYKGRTLISAFNLGPGSAELTAHVSYTEYPFNTPVTLIAYVFKR